MRPVYFVIVAALLAGCSASGNQGTDTPTGGTVGEVSTLTVTDQVETSGTLSADQLSRLTWNTTGAVESVGVQAAVDQRPQRRRLELCEIQARPLLAAAQHGFPFAAFRDDVCAAAERPHPPSLRQRMRGARVV